MGKEALVEGEEALCPHNLDETIEWVFVQRLTLLIVRSRQDRVKDVLSGQLLSRKWMQEDTITQHTPTPDAAEAARCFLGPSLMRSCFSMNLFDAL